MYHTLTLQAGGSTADQLEPTHQCKILALYENSCLPKFDTGKFRLLQFSGFKTDIQVTFINELKHRPN